MILSKNEECSLFSENPSIRSERPKGANRTALAAGAIARAASTATLRAMPCWIAAAMVAVTLPLAAQSASPDAIYYHGHILTGVGLGESKLDFVSAIAMRDGIVTATGTDESLLKTRGPRRSWSILAAPSPCPASTMRTPT